MVLTPSNYMFHYRPNRKRPMHVVDIEVKEEFVEFLRGQKIDYDKYEKIAIDAMKVNDVSECFIEQAEREGVCRWEEGLLTYISIPFGDAAAMALDLGVPTGSVYRSHNIDSCSQSSVILAVMTRYLSNMDMRIEYMNRRNP